MTARQVVLWMFLGVFAAFGLYMVKYRVQELKKEVAMNETQLREEKKNLHVLTAEWTYLNRPERLQQLSAHYLKITPVHGAQMTDVASVPSPSELEQPASAEMPRPQPRGLLLVSGTQHAR